MPQTYSQRSREYSQSTGAGSSSNSLPAERDHGGFVPPVIPEGPTDADDAIFLSDLIRTGEASRLRRRGAMRIDHNHPHHATSMGHILPGAPPRVSSPSIVLVDRANWDSDEDLESPVFASHSNAEESSTRARRHLRMSRRFGPYSLAGTSSSSPHSESQEEYVHTLVCGAEVSEWEEADVEPFQPSILPLYPTPKSSPSSRRKVKKSTGCGAVVHLHAAPRPKFRLWAARTFAPETVVPLDARYFDHKEASRFSRSSCGCVKEGIGCAICGNPLGTRYTPCKSASEGLFCPRLPEKRSSSHINSGVYSSSGEPLSTAHRSTSKPTYHIYTFFAGAVSSTSSYTFPSSSIERARSRSSLENTSASPNGSPTLSSTLLPPEPLFFNNDEDDDSDSENFPPNLYGNGWRSVAGAGLGSGLDINMVTILDSPVALRPPSPAPPSSGMLLDRFTNSSPVAEPDNIPPTNSADMWGQPTSPQAPAQPVYRTRTGRTARRSGSRVLPSLSSGLGGGTSNVVSHQSSFFERQLQNASEREMQDVRIADSGHWTSLETPASSGSSSGPSSLAVDADGDVMVWGVNIPEATLMGSNLGWGSRSSNEGWDGTTSSREAEYKPSDIGFIDR